MNMDSFSKSILIVKYLINKKIVDSFLDFSKFKFYFFEEKNYFKNY